MVYNGNSYEKEFQQTSDVIGEVGAQCYCAKDECDQHWCYNN